MGLRFTCKKATVIAALISCFSLPGFAEQPDQAPMTCREYLSLSIPEKYAFYSLVKRRLRMGDDLSNIERLIPNLKSKLLRAFHVSQTRWAQSTFYDAAANEYYVTPTLLERFGIPVYFDDGSKVTFRPQAYVEAGVMHTYGYLLSQLKTKYGFKGARWIEGRIDERLGLPAGTFSPFNESGEFLTDLTAALDVVVNGQNPNAILEMALLEKVEWHDFSPTSLEHQHEGDILTLLYRLPRVLENDSDPNRWLVIYAIRLDYERQFRYVTAYPTDENYLDRVVNQALQNHDKPFEPQNNLYLPTDWVSVSYKSRIKLRQRR